MKAYCINCGCHFPGEFKQTLEPPCNFWGDRGASNISVEWKEKIWNWYFGIDMDAFFLETGMTMVTSLNICPVEKGTTFKEKVPNWEQLTDQQRQEYEKAFFKSQNRNDNIVRADLSKLSDQQLEQFGSQISKEFVNRKMNKNEQKN